MGASALALVCVFVINGCGHRASSGQATSPPLTPAPVTTGDYPSYGHAADFSWIAGRFTASLRHGDCALIAFSATPNAPWGGKIELEAPAGMLAGFSDGDMIVAHGDFDRTPHGSCGAVAYVARRIEQH